MKRYLAIGMVAVVLVLLGISLAGCNAGSGGSPSALNLRLDSSQQGLWVNGQGKVITSPDIVALSLGVSAQASTVSDAQSQAAAAMDRVMSSLTGSGLAKKDIQTTSFSVQQVTRWDNDKQQEVVIGYRVSNMVNAKIRTLDKTGTIIDAVVQAGGDLTRVNGITFSVEDPSKYYVEAREKAMNDAKAKAEQMAKLAGISLGKPVYITESTIYAPPVPMPVPVFKDAAGAAPSTQISPGELEITLNVQINYAIS